MAQVLDFAILMTFVLQDTEKQHVNLGDDVHAVIREKPYTVINCIVQDTCLILFAWLTVKKILKSGSFIHIWKETLQLQVLLVGIRILTKSILI